MSEGLPESCHACRGKGSAGHAAHHHRQPSSAGAIGLQWCSLAQFTAGQMGFVASAVHGVVPVCGLPPASEHPGQMEEKERRFLWDDGSFFIWTWMWRECWTLGLFVRSPDIQLQIKFNVNHVCDVQCSVEWTIFFYFPLVPWNLLVACSRALHHGT